MKWPREAFQVVGQPTAWTKVRQQVAADRQTTLAQWQQVADERNARIAAFYAAFDRLTKPTKRTTH